MGFLINRVATIRSRLKWPSSMTTSHLVFGEENAWKKREERERERKRRRSSASFPSPPKHTHGSRLTKVVTTCFTETVRRSQWGTSGADPGFFLGWGALVSCSTSTPINHIVFFFLQNTSCITKTAGHLGGRGGGGVRTPCTLPLDPPLYLEFGCSQVRFLVWF